MPIELRDVPPYQYPLNSKIVYVVLFNGRAPALKQEKFQIVLPYVGYTGIAFPRYEYFPTVLPGVEVGYKANNTEQLARTEVVADFDAIMSQEYHDKLPSMITRLVISTLTKELASYAIVHAAKQSGRGEAEIAVYVLTGFINLHLILQIPEAGKRYPKMYKSLICRYRMMGSYVLLR